MVVSDFCEMLNEHSKEPASCLRGSGQAGVTDGPGTRTNVESRNIAGPAIA